MVKIKMLLKFKKKIKYLNKLEFNNLMLMLKVTKIISENIITIKLNLSYKK